jgi:hypothetical protein
MYTNLNFFRNIFYSRKSGDIFNFECTCHCTVCDSVQHMERDNVLIRTFSILLILSGTAHCVSGHPTVVSHFRCNFANFEWHCTLCVGSSHCSIALSL